MKSLKIDKSLTINIVFAAALIVFAVIVFNLPVNAFIIVMPIFAGIIFLSIFLLPEEKDKK